MKNKHNKILFPFIILLLKIHPSAGLQKLTTYRMPVRGVSIKALHSMNDLTILMMLLCYNLFKNKVIINNINIVITTVVDIIIIIVVVIVIILLLLLFCIIIVIITINIIIIIIIIIIIVVIVIIRRK